MKKVGVAVVVNQGRVLVGVRPEGTVLSGYHEFPGGKCEPAESAAACAVRECREETGLDVQVVETLLHRQHQYPHGAVDLTFFLCHPLGNGTPVTPFEWISIERLRELKFPEANEEVVLKLLNRYEERSPQKSSGDKSC